MTTPRNRPAYERAQASRAEIRAILCAYPQTAAPLTAKQIWPLLSRELSVRQIQIHMAAIHAEIDRPRETTPKPSHLALAALHPEVAKTHPDAHEKKRRTRSITARLFDGGGSGAARTFEKHALSADRGGQIPDSSPRPPAVDPSGRTGPAPVIDKLDGFRDREVKKEDQRWEPDFC